MDQVKEAPLQSLSPDPNTVQLGEHRRNVWHVQIPAGVTAERVCESDYWVHLTKRLRVDDKIEARAKDGSWYAEFLVDKVMEAQGVRVWRVAFADRRVKTEAESKGGAEDYRVELAGPHKWRVLRIADKQVIHKGEPDHAAAQGWLDTYLKAA